MSDLHFRTLSDVCRSIKSGSLKATATTQHILQRIDELEPELKSFALSLADSALAQAEALDAKQERGEPLGLLHGVPIAVKDLIYTKDTVTASGTKVMADFRPQFDATVLTKLRAAGAVIIGKTQLTEGAFGAHHPEISAPVNPWHKDYWSGVSSSGSGVSVAAGLAYGAIGTDTGGSIRFPSVCNGLVGIKPTYGRVSRYGVFPLAETLDHIGPMTRTVEDAARMLQAMAGADVNDPTSLPGPVPNFLQACEAGVEGFKLGVDWRYVSDGVEPAVVASVHKAIDVFENLGVQIVEVAMPASYAQLVKHWGVTCGVECARAHADYYPVQKSQYGPVLATLIEQGLSATQADYDTLEQTRAQFRSEMNSVMQQVNAFICPALPITVPTVALMAGAVASDAGRVDFLTFTAPADYSGHPTLSLPVDLHEDLPRGIQLVGAHCDETTLITLAANYEAAAGFSQHPNY